MVTEGKNLAKDINYSFKMHGENLNKKNTPKFCAMICHKFTPEIKEKEQSQESRRETAPCSIEGKKYSEYL